MIPRLRGRVGQADESEGEYAGKWFFQILVADVDLKHGEGLPTQQIGPYDTEAEAKAELERAIKMCAEDIEKRMTGKVSGKFWDMKDNEKLKAWKDLKHV